MADLVSRLNDNNKNVRKWGTMAMLVADYGTPVPDKLWNDDGTPADFGAEFKMMGYVTTDGFKNSQSVDLSLIPHLTLPTIQ